jgi:hypothetical protein
LGQRGIRMGSGEGFIMRSLIFCTVHLLEFIKIIKSDAKIINESKLMNRPIRVQHPLLKIVNNALIDLPSPSNIRT